MVPKSDAQIQTDVQHELQWDHRIRATDIGVSVEKGIVTLRGIVDSNARKFAAQEAAHRVAGVLDVANDIDIHIGEAHERTDTDIARAVRDTLVWNVLVPDDRITSTVSKGVVTLEGTVDSFTEMDDAMTAVRDLQGVRAVLNNITIRKRAIDSAGLRKSIEEALERVAEREARRVGVSITDHTVMLTGSVHSLTEKNAVSEVVRNAEGVANVVNKLIVEPVM